MDEKRSGGLDGLEHIAFVVMGLLKAIHAIEDHDCENCPGSALGCSKGLPDEAKPQQQSFKFEGWGKERIDDMREELHKIIIILPKMKSLKLKPVAVYNHVALAYRHINQMRSRVLSDLEWPGEWDEDKFTSQEEFEELTADIKTGYEDLEEPLNEITAKLTEEDSPATTRTEKFHKLIVN